MVFAFSSSIHWLRGLLEQAARIDIWAKEIALARVRRRFTRTTATSPSSWKRYRKELGESEAQARALRQRISRRKATLLYATKADAHNHAQLVEQFLERLD